MSGRDPYKPWDGDFWAWKIGARGGAAIGMVVGGVMGFGYAGLGGALFGALVCFLPGGIFGMYIGSAIAYIPVVAEWLQGCLILLGIVGIVYLLISSLWGVGRP